MRVLVADKFEPTGLAELRAIGMDVQYQPEVKEDSLVSAIVSLNPDVLVVRSTKVDAAMLEAGALKLVVRAGAGYNTIDVATASRRGIYVSNCPGQNAIAVAELAFALMLGLDRRIVENVSSLRAGQWNKQEFSSAHGLAGTTLGLIGLGRIGRHMVTRAQAFGMNVIGWSRGLASDRAAELGINYRTTPAEVAAESDVVSVHLALAPETRELIGTEFFNSMRQGAIFINTSRGEVVDQAALIEAMHKRDIRAGLDVYAAEPAGGKGEFTDPIHTEPNLYGTHHIGASTTQAQEAIAAETVRIIQAYKETGRVPNVVNLARSTPATHMLIVRHCDRPGVLAQVFDGLKRAGINVQEMENVIFEGAQAAVARINLDNAPTAEVLRSMKAENAHIIELSLVKLN